MKKHIFTLAALIVAGIQIASAEQREYSADVNRMGDTVDDTVYFQGLIDSLPANSILRIPAGTLTLSAPIGFTKQITVVGADNNLSELRFVAAGGLNITGQMTMTDLALVTQVAGGGIAIKATAGLPRFHRLAIKGATTNSFWNQSVRIEGLSVDIYDCVMQGKNNGTNGTLYHFEHTGQTGGGGKIRMGGCTMIGAQYGVYVHNTDAEGQRFENVIIRDVAVGAWRATSEPGPSWDGCWIQASSYGIQFDSARDSIMRNCVVESGSVGISLTYRTLQHLGVRANLMFARTPIEVPTKAPNGETSKLIDHVVVSGNYLKCVSPGANDAAYKLVGSDTTYFYAGGNILDNVTQEALLNGNGQYLLKTKLEVR